MKRLYEPADASDGTRILIDGIWPRGVKREEWPERSWRSDLAPSRELREWYGHDTDRFVEFSDRYRAELAGKPGIEDLLVLTGPLTLVTATRDVDHSHAAVLGDFLRNQSAV